MIEGLLKKAVAIPLFVKFNSRLVDGFYDYSQAPTQQIMRLKPNSGIYIDGISFGASCKTWDFASAAVDGIGIQFSTLSGREPVLLRPLKFYSFSDYMTLNGIVTGYKPASLNLNQNRQDDYLTVSINGKIRQTEALIKDNKTEVNVLISIAAYEITDADILNKMTRNYSEPQGKPTQNFVQAPQREPSYAPPVNTNDPPPPARFMANAKRWSGGGIGIERWQEDEM